MMDGMSMNLEQANLDKLRAVFPECFAEGNTAQLRLRISADLLHHFCSFKNGKYIQYFPVFETLNWHKISR